MHRLCGMAAWLALTSAGVGQTLPGPTRPESSPPPVNNDAPRPPAPSGAAAGADVNMEAPALGVTGPSLLNPMVQPLDLNTALRLAGVQNPELNVARQRVVEAVAQRQFAAAQILPTINAGGNYDTHTGVLQQSNGNILSVNRSALFVGGGSNAVAAGTVNIPGLVLSGNVGSGVYAYLAARQEVQVREFGVTALRNQVFLEVARTYTELVRAEGLRAISLQAVDEARKVAELTADYAKIGEGRQADADRAAAELAQREADFQQAEGLVNTSSARLAQTINIDAAIRLHPTDAMIVPLPIVPAPISVQELIAIGLMQRPELAQRRAAIRQALLVLDGAKILPFSPNIILGFSAGGFGGGSNLVRPYFGGFGARSDFDAVGWWSIQNMGVGNMALINTARARLQASQFEQLSVLNRVRAEVAESYALTHAQFAQIGTTEMATRSGKSAFERDYARIRERAVERGNEVLPIELLNSFRLLARSRRAYLDAIVDYNIAQFALYVALGQPPANMLSRPVPNEGIEPSNVANPTPVPAEPAGGAPMPAPAPPAVPNQPGPFAAPPAAAAPTPPPARVSSLPAGIRPTQAPASAAADPDLRRTSNPR